MPQSQTQSDTLLQDSFRTLVFTVLVNTGIAIFLAFIGFHGGQFWEMFIFSQCIGLSICSSILTANLIFKSASPLRQTVARLGGLLIGAIVGTMLGSVLTGNSPLLLLQDKKFGQTLFLGLFFGTIILYFFTVREHLAEAKAAFQEERIKRITGEKLAIEADLKRLQAQVEPHFLFNTLSNVLSLMDTDTATGKTMLESLTRYLRTSLDRTRREVSTIGQEMAMIKDYMEIHKIRMGDRFDYHIDIPEAALGLPFPPMLIQPLVENSIRHGLEPKIEGGRLDVRVSTDDEMIRVAISDTGVGIQDNVGYGVGLSNVKERLAGLYGDEGKLTLEENHPYGLTVNIEVPRAAH